MYASNDPNMTLRAGRRMQVTQAAAVKMRSRYLIKHSIELILQENPIADIWARDALKEIRFLNTKKNHKPEQPQGNGISDDDIQAARDYPVERLVDFNRGKATAWCHEDKTPSLYHAHRNNRVNCPVCNKSFNAIDILVTRDGMSFHDSVKELRG